MAAPGEQYRPRRPGFESWLRSRRKQERRAFLASRPPQVRNKEAVDALYDSVVTLVRMDVQKADRLAQAGAWIAAEIDDPGATAQSARALGHVLYISGKYRQAIAEYEQAPWRFSAHRA